MHLRLERRALPKYNLIGRVAPLREKFAHRFAHQFPHVAFRIEKKRNRVSLLLIVELLEPVPRGAEKPFPAFRGPVAEVHDPRQEHLVVTKQAGIFIVEFPVDRAPPCKNILRRQFFVLADRKFPPHALEPRSRYFTNGKLRIILEHDLIRLGHFRFEMNEKIGRNQTRNGVSYVRDGEGGGGHGVKNKTGSASAGTLPCLSSNIWRPAHRNHGAT